MVTGHCRLNGHLSKMRLHSDPKVEAVFSKRKQLADTGLDKAKISELSASDILRFAMLSKKKVLF
jgi:hypothetical protein